MINVLILSTLASITSPADFEYDSFVYGENWFAYVHAEYWEYNQTFEYTIFNSTMSEGIDFFALNQSFSAWDDWFVVDDDFYLPPGGNITFTVEDWGAYGWMWTNGYLSSSEDECGTMFLTIAPLSIPTPGAFALLGVAGLVRTRHRRRR